MKVSWKGRILVAERAVVDGDSAYLFFDEGERSYTNPLCRFYGIDCPEMNGRHSKLWRDDPRADAIAKQAKAFVVGKIQGKEIFCRSLGMGKYGRRLPLIWTSQAAANSENPRQSLNQALINQGLAKRYYDTQKVLRDKP